MLDWYLKWHPPIMHDLHESVPFLYTFSGQAPQNPTLDPILYGELPWFANFEMAQLTKYGMPGVWTHAFVDMWSPGYLAFMSSNHNGMIRMYETFGNGGATTMKRRRRAAREGAGPDQTRASGIARCRRTRKSCGRCATTPTTCRPACSRRCELTSSFPEGHPRELLPEEPQLDRVRQEGSAVRLRHPRRAEGPDARRPARQPAARPGHRGRRRRPAS